jgi:hypothetical protein
VLGGSAADPVSQSTLTPQREACKPARWSKAVEAPKRRPPKWRGRVCAYVSVAARDRQIGQPLIVRCLIPTSASDLLLVLTTDTADTHLGKNANFTPSLYLPRWSRVSKPPSNHQPSSCLFLCQRVSTCYSMPCSLFPAVSSFIG